MNGAGEETPLLLRESNSTGNLQRSNSTSPVPSLFWNNQTDCPMTTHPHFGLSQRQSPHSHTTGTGLDRVRSCSLGAEVEAARFDNGSFVVLPSLEIPKANKDGVVTAANVDTRQSPASAATDSLDSGNPVWISIMYGIINATIVLPVLMSFGSIIYRDQAFEAYMPMLVKLTVVSGVVHQVCFSTFSTLPFAVGQVQDAGLIFLSQMASRMVQHCQSREYDDDTLLATVTVGLSLCTAILGCGLVLMGHFRLAQYVQMLPTSVVGGYLAYIGWFCGEAGVALMAGSSGVTLKLFASRWVFILPGLVGGLFIYTSVRKFRHMAVLPSCILVLILLFYGLLWVTGTTLEEARSDGWMRQMEAAPIWYRTWDCLRLNKVAWMALPELVLTEFGMLFVVALSSSLDVAAIQLELQRPLDYNHELKTVGISNIISGFTGGYTGSYIFSQSIFSLRAGIRSRLAGYVLALCQVVFLVLPFPVLSFVPNFFFGSLLSMICIDLMYEWLWDVRTKLTPVEYVVCLATFGLIQVLNVEYGILAGVALNMAFHKMGFNVGDPKIAITDEIETVDAIIVEEAQETEGESLGLDLAQ